VRFGTGADGLPVGIQVLAPALADDRVFQVAAVLEAAAPMAPADPAAPQTMATEVGR
jgi:Asp-tRNA(Asn)/Glu-tRNA(Gln) amidotransferase A subunit family amidase